MVDWYPIFVHNRRARTRQSNRITMAPERRKTGAVLPVSDPNGLIVRSQDDLLAIRRERDRNDPTAMALERRKAGAAPIQRVEKKN